MKTNFFASVTTTFVLLVYSGSLFSQETLPVKKYFERLPNIKLEEKTPQKYLMVIDYLEFDLYGNFNRKKRITGEYTRGLMNNYVKWNNVGIAYSKKLDESFSEGEKQPFMEDFSYVLSEEMLNKSFFKDIPEADVHMKTLVWDMALFELLAWVFWDSIELNLEYAAGKINSVLQIEGLGTIENKDVKITWTGITEKNDKLCAAIKFHAMNNPLFFEVNNATMHGRSHYWGNIYVSLSDKQIEYGELYEDVVMAIKMAGQETGQQVNTVRTISLEKIR